MDFLDLTDATDTEKRRLQDLLYNNKCAGVQVSPQAVTRSACNTVFLLGPQLPFVVSQKKPFVVKGPTTKNLEPDSCPEKGQPDSQAEGSLTPRNGHQADDPAHQQPVPQSAPHSSLTSENQPFVPQSHDMNLFAASPAFDPSHKLSPHSGQHALSPNHSAGMTSLPPIPYPIVTHMPVMSSMGPMMRPNGPGIDVRSGSAGATGGSHSPLVSGGATGMPFSFIGPNGTPFIPGQPLPPVTAGQHPGPGYHGPNGQQMFPPFIPYPYFFVPQAAYPPPHMQPHDQRQQMLDEGMMQRDHHMNQQQQSYPDRDMAGSRSGGSSHSHGSGGRRINRRNQRKQQSVTSGGSSSPSTPHSHHQHHHHNNHNHNQQSQHQFHSNHRQAEHSVTPSVHLIQGSNSRQTRSPSSTSSSSQVVLVSPPASLSSCPCFSDEETASAATTTTTAAPSDEEKQTPDQQAKQPDSAPAAPPVPQSVASQSPVPVTASPAPVVAVDAKKVTPKKRTSPSVSKTGPQSNGHSAAPTGKPPFGPKSWSSLFKSAAQSLPVTGSAAIHTTTSAASPTQAQMYDRVCLGGTFDSIHDGHRKLLNESLSKCTEILTIGVTDESMIRKKVLWELIKPVEERIDEVRSYCESQLKTMGKTGVKLDIVPISDPFGPAITDSTLKAIIVSDETMAGGSKINEIRKSNGMPLLAVISIRLIHSDHKESSLEEDKVSSSTLRIRRLGTLLKEPVINPRLNKRPYLIGLTGGIASGKTSIANEFKKLGAGVIDCDKMAHQAYVPGTPAHEKIVREFGPDVVDPRTNAIIRKKLGEKVFSNSAAKAKLESIVWPEASKLVFQEAERLRSQEKKEVVIFEATQLIESKWSQRMHQVWVSMIPEDVAVKRVMERDSMSENEARLRIRSQMSNKERVSHANVVFSSLWDRDFTRAQVQKAWNMLHKRFLRAV